MAARKFLGGSGIVKGGRDRVGRRRDVGPRSESFPPFSSTLRRIQAALCPLARGWPFWGTSMSRVGTCEPSCSTRLATSYDLLSYIRMRRSIHIAITLVVSLALIRPFDCFAGTFTRKAAACCAKGKCLPKSNADECCKGTVPGGNQLSTPKTADNSTPILALMPAEAPSLAVPTFVSSGFDEAHAPPGSPPGSNINLPLLI